MGSGRAGLWAARMRYTKYVTLLAALILGSALNADDLAEGRSKAQSCIENKDWECAFESMTEALSSQDGIDFCTGKSTGVSCWSDMIFLKATAAGASANATPEARRDIAERALSITKVIEGDLKGGELILSGLRYDACKAMNDRACMDESAQIIRPFLDDSLLDPRFGHVAARDTENRDELIIAEAINYTKTYYYIDGTGYPVDLNAVAAEVMQMEPSE